MNGLTEHACRTIMDAWTDGAFRAPWEHKPGAQELPVGPFTLRATSEGFFLVLRDGSADRVQGIAWSYGIQIRMDGWSVYCGRSD